MKMYSLWFESIQTGPLLTGYQECLLKHWHLGAGLIKKMIAESILESCFVPMRRFKKKFGGKWHEVMEKLFPGYVFLITEQPLSLYEELKKIPTLTRIIGRFGEYFTPLSTEDVRMIKKLQGSFEKSGNLEVEISRIAVEEGKRIRILSGPLVNLEGQVKKVNLHKRVAEVEMEFMGRQTMIYLGIEIVERIR